jgi:Protein of unknown function (DUF982)
MDAALFRVPVRLHVEGATFEVGSLSDALTFLREWPVSRRGPVYQCALKGCEAALHGGMALEDARKALESFARITGILAGRQFAETAMVAPRLAIVPASHPH